MPNTHHPVGVNAGTWWVAYCWSVWSLGNSSNAIAFALILATLAWLAYGPDNEP